MMHTKQTSTTHTVIFQNVTSDAHTLEMTYENAFLWLWERQKVCNKHPGCIQIFPAVVRHSTIL